MGADKTFGNRFDDPEGEYRVLYATASLVLSNAWLAFVPILACRQH
jgi:hypothetical protein